MDNMLSSELTDKLSYAIEIVVSDQEPSLATSRAIEMINRSIGERACVTKLAKRDQFMSHSNHVILFLPQYPARWKDLVSSVTLARADSHLLVLLEKSQEGSLQRLAATHIDDFIIFPTEPEEEFLNRIHQFSNLRPPINIKKLRKELQMMFGGTELIGESTSFLRSIEKIHVISKVDSIVLITGGSGTGKELCARAIHYLGDRSSKPFLPINCGAIPDSLFENELFGHDKGAYTDASKVQRGLLAEGDGGTVFLDEINSLTLNSQVKLLRFLEDRQFRPLGCSQVFQSDIRIICATNVSLKDEVRSGRFREDLYYRINILNIDLPALSERGADVRLLIEYFIDRFSKFHRKGKMLCSHEAMDALLRYQWPGNVRELRNAIERAVLMSPTHIIRERDISFDQKDIETKKLTVQDFGDARKQVIMQFEREYLREAMRAHDDNITQASASVRLDRRSFQRLLRKYNLQFVSNT